LVESLHYELLSLGAFIFQHCFSLSSTETSNVIYLDSNSTTVMLPDVVEAMLPWLRGNHANPSGNYRMAKLARKAIDTAREQVAALIGAEAGEIVFTGSGTESVNTALNALDTLSGEGTALVSAIEHSAVLRYVESGRREVVQVAVGSDGRIDLDSLCAALPLAAYV
jgi:cysteine desulfurase